MKRYIILIIIVPLFFFSCSSTKYKILDDGVLIRLKDNTGKTTLKVQVINDNIIHVLANPGNKVVNEKSLMVVNQPKTTTDWQVSEKDDVLRLKTPGLHVNISLLTGEISYADTSDNDLLVEKNGGGKSFKSITVEGKPFYTIRQVFESPDDEAFYGLGAHQHNIMNYKGKDVDLYQHNIVDIIPFLVSSRRYGILWDNYSHSKFGDPRDYIDIDSLKLYDDNGDEGGLSALYSDKTDPAKVYLKRQEDKIRYEYLSDLKNVPPEFPMADGKVTWSGYIGTNESGTYKFYAYSAGYMKLWFDGKLLLDTWRQCWNPWSHLLDLSMEAGTKYPLRIEWIPDGGESYIALKYKSPIDAVEQNQLSLWSEVANQIDYYFITGENTDEIIAGYRQLTGKCPIMPKWAMGFWQSRERYRTQEELLDVVKEFRARHIPLDNIVLDWFYWPEDKWGDHGFDSTRFPDPKAMIEELHKDLHTQIMISVWPKLYVGTENYKYMSSKGWVYTKNVENKQKDWVGYVSTFYDVFNPNARKYFWDQMNKKLFSLGIDAWWMDATEPDILSNTSIEQRKELMSPLYIGPSAEYFNAYSLENSRAVYEGQRSVKPDQRVFILTRSAYAGQQRYASATWSGDVACRWYDLKAQISAGLNFCISGIPYWTTDIGGFALENRYYNPTGKDLEEWRELNTRWYQFGVFCPLFRVHGQYPYREVFNIAPGDNPAYKSMLYYDKLRYRLMPYIYTLAGNTFQTDYTIMRALVMDFPDDALVRSIGDQFMFGPSIMVCPVHEFNLRSRQVYLPAGCGWYDFYTGKYYEGGQSIKAEAPLEKVPLYVKEGSIIPVGPDIEYTLQPTDGTITLWIYEGKNAQFSLYEDENVNYNYEKGAYAYTPLTYDEPAKSLIIHKREGTYAGMPGSREIHVVVVNKQKPIGFNAETLPLEKVVYNGEDVTLNLNN
jgi:alpha-D-xyloside xylohydrolase